MLSKIPSLDLCALHYNRSKTDVHIIIDYGVGYIAGMLDVHVISDCCREGECLIGYPEGRLDGSIVSDFSVGSHPDWVVQSIDHCTEANIAVMSDGYISVDCCVRCDMSGFRECKSVFLDVEYVSVSADGL
jgi:hypothetical protein